MVVFVLVVRCFILSFVDIDAPWGGGLLPIRLGLARKVLCAKTIVVDVDDSGHRQRDDDRHVDIDDYATAANSHRHIDIIDCANTYNINVNIDVGRAARCGSRCVLSALSPRAQWPLAARYRLSRREDGDRHRRRDRAFVRVRS